MSRKYKWMEVSFPIINDGTVSMSFDSRLLLIAYLIFSSIVKRFAVRILQELDGILQFGHVLSASLAVFFIGGQGHPVRIFANDVQGWYQPISFRGSKDAIQTRMQFCLSFITLVRVPLLYIWNLIHTMNMRESKMRMDG